MSRRKPGNIIVVVGLLLTAGVIVGVALSGLAGCGSVGDVGSGASRGGVQPVQGVYGYGSSGYSSADAAKQEKRLESLSKLNKKRTGKTASLVKKTKRRPDAPSSAIPQVQAQTRPTLSETIKVAVVSRDGAPAASAPRVAEEGRDEEYYE